MDFGQEDWDDEAYSGDESNPAKRAKQGAKARGVFNNLAPKPKKKPTERVSNLFLGTAAGWKRRLPWLPPPPHQPTWRLLRLTPLLQTPERRQSGLEARRGLSSLRLRRHQS